MFKYQHSQLIQIGVKYLYYITMNYDNNKINNIF